MSCTPSTTSTTCTTGVVSHRGRRVYVAVGSRLLRVNRAVQRVAVATRVSTSLARQRIPHRPHILHIECKLARTTYRDSSASRCPSPGVDRTQAFNHPPPLYLSTLLTSLTSPHHPSPTCSRVRQRTRYTVHSTSLRTGLAQSTTLDRHHELVSFKDTHYSITLYSLH